jgi:hypothetical protein
MYKDCIKGSENNIPSAERFRGQLNHLILRVRYPFVVNGGGVSPFLQTTKALRESRGIALLCF